MKRISRITRLVYGAVLLLVPAFTSSSLAAADDGLGPLGVTSVAAVTAQSARVGALFGPGRRESLPGGHFCTASVVHSAHHNLIVTAAHCLDATGEGGALFVPGYRDGRAPYGVWTVRRTFLPTGWAKGQSEDSDVAFAVLDERDGRNVEDFVGGNRFATGTTTGATAVTVTGYPDSREVPVGCTNKPVAHSSTQQRITCPDFTGGTSGSPWVNGDGSVVGILGGHEQGGTTADISYSVVLGDEAEELYEGAATDQ
ncbi:trypsin-like peptidase domain-containing protein [Streptomyces griseoviridis]|uniref:Serine protease n=2 Tax=Streptomyces TaxID=1883 RepID=A0A3Q9KUP0_STRGD|nr:MULTISPECIES: trypsin-like peptidase domain-containing protein [Streptomyces]AZS86365.1 trypsin-like serine protease [Streptomyces griseoviridis]MDH6700231.1 hypothetical protein [Streptomyces sp. MAA16]MDT0477910.1 trypsin-like peptidase domain-containing protein [Streptomyces sp. DSM 41014]QCN86772.1 serine protease [Streptomyces griseoviridis]